MSTATQTIEELANREYKYGFVTEVETETIPRGLNEDVIQLISGQERGTGVVARVASQGLSGLVHHDRADLA